MITRQQCKNLYKNEEKQVLTEKVSRILKNKTYKYLNSLSRYVCINILNYIVDEYSNTYHRSIKMKPIDVKSNTRIG